MGSQVLFPYFPRTVSQCEAPWVRRLAYSEKSRVTCSHWLVSPSPTALRKGPPQNLCTMPFLGSSTTSVCLHALLKERRNVLLSCCVLAISCSMLLCDQLPRKLSDKIMHFRSKAKRGPFSRKWILLFPFKVVWACEAEFKHFNTVKSYIYIGLDISATSFGCNVQYTNQPVKWFIYWILYFMLILIYFSLHAIGYNVKLTVFVCVFYIQWLYINVNA